MATRRRIVREWTLQAFGHDVAAVVAALDLTNVVLIGHSMGGKVVVEAAQAAGRPGGGDRRGRYLPQRRAGRRHR
jgi:pimeloyl-ACP methyl ester carboxylesterase